MCYHTVRRRLLFRRLAGRRDRLWVPWLSNPLRADLLSLHDRSRRTGTRIRNEECVVLIRPWDSRPSRWLGGSLRAHVIPADEAQPIADLVAHLLGHRGRV